MVFLTEAHVFVYKYFRGVFHCLTNYFPLGQREVRRILKVMVAFASDLKLIFEDPVFECLTARTKDTRGYMCRCTLINNA